MQHATDKLIIETIDGHFYDFPLRGNSPVLPENMITSNHKIKSLFIPEGITEISSSAFQDCHSLTNVSLPQSLIKIGNFAFANCINLSQINFPPLLEQIGNHAFERCKLTSVEFGNELKLIGDSAFMCCDQIKTIKLPLSLETIRANAFMYCENLSVVNIPYLIEEIPVGSFSFCTNLHDVKIDGQIKVVGRNAFTSCTNLTAIDLPDSVIRIGGSAFARCSSLKTITVPKKVQELGALVFFDCPGLEEIKFLNEHIEVKPSTISDTPKLHQIKLANQVIVDVASGSTLESFCKVGSSYYFSEDNNGQKRYGVSIKNKNTYTESELAKLLNPSMFAYVQKSHCEAMIKLAPWLQLPIKDLDLRCLDLPIVLNLPASVENYNAIRQGAKKWNFVQAQLISKNIEYQSNIFKLAFAIGAFCGDEKISSRANNVLKDIVKNNHISDATASASFANFNLTYGYQPSFANYFIGEYERDYKFLQKLTSFKMDRLYNEIGRIKKHTTKVRKANISKLDRGIKRLKSSGVETGDEEQLLQTLKTNLKDSLSTDEIVNYMQHHKFYIRSGNEALKEIINYIDITANQGIFDQIQNLFELSLAAPAKTMPTVRDANVSGYTYAWLKGNDPLNIAAGYAVGCCAVVQETGASIVEASMLSPDVQNLVVFDENYQIVGKSTVFYNVCDNYLLLNNMHIAKHCKTPEVAVRTILRGVREQVLLMEHLGKSLTSVHVGLHHNKQVGHLEACGCQITYEHLLPNYDFYPYHGDANNPDYGQAVLYKKASMVRTRTKEVRELSPIL